MKKTTAALALFLALALVFSAMPIATAQANELTMVATGGIIPAFAPGPRPIASVTEDATGLDWVDDLGLSLNFFQLGGRLLRPGTDGVYEFTLNNDCTQPIDYWFSLSAFTSSPEFQLPIQYTLTVNGGAPALITPTAAPNTLMPAGTVHNSGTLAPGASASFRLEWEWPFMDGSYDGARYDTPIGIGALAGLTYTVALTFVVECDPVPTTTRPDTSTTEPPTTGDGTTAPPVNDTTGTTAPPGNDTTTTGPTTQPPPRDPWWRWPVIGGAIVGGAIIGGGMIAGGIAISTLPAWALVALLPVLTYIGWAHCCPRSCVCDKCETKCPPPCTDISPDNNQPQQPPREPPVQAPQTGDSYVWPVVLVVLVLIAGFGLVFLLKGRKKDSEA